MDIQVETWGTFKIANFFSNLFSMYQYFIVMFVCMAHACLVLIKVREGP